MHKKRQMAAITSFTFNPFQENTYIIYDETKECIIIDPGCYHDAEKRMLTEYIKGNDLKPVRLLNTHCHLDHIFGNQFIYETYGLLPEIHQKELPILASYPMVAQKYGVLNAAPSPVPKQFIEQDEVLTFGTSKCTALFAPGHSPASLCFYFEEEGFVIVGDVLFKESIGRTDLLGGDYNTLINSIKTQLMPMSDKVVVFSGHGPQTTIGHERLNNPFLK